MKVDRISRLILKMQKGMADGMMRGMDEGMRELLQEMMKGALDPAKLAETMRQMGIDPSQIPGMMGRVPGLDPYKILGLEKSASDEEVKKRYRDLLHQLHPDTAGTPGTEFLFQMVTAAFELIKRERGWQ